MSPLRDIECITCHNQYETLIKDENEWKLELCPSCGGNNLQLKFPFPANYTIQGANGASTRPKQMGGKK